jgi:hypothetical protein
MMLNRRLFVVGVAASVVPVPALSLTWTQEATEIIREVKRAAEFAKMLVAVKEGVMHEYRVWRSVFDIHNFRSLTTALGNVTRTYYPDANEIPQLMRTGQSIVGGGGTMTLDRMLSRGTVSRVATGFGNMERWFETIEDRQRLVAFSRQVSTVAITNSRNSIAALGNAQQIYATNQGVAEATAGLAAIQLAGNNTQANMVQLEAIRLRIETERRHNEIREEERDRMAAMQYAQETEWAVRQLGGAR